MSALAGRAALATYCAFLVFLTGFLTGGDYRDIKRRQQITEGANIYLKFSKADAAVYQCQPVVIITADGLYPVPAAAK